MDYELLVKILLISTLTVELGIRTVAFLSNNKNRKRYLPISFITRLLVFVVILVTYNDLISWINTEYAQRTGESFLTRTEMWLALIIIYPAVLVVEEIEKRKRNSSETQETMGT